MEHFGLSHILFEPDKYNPDTLDLLVDEEAREYWLNTCEKLVEKYVKYAISNTEDPTVEIRALKYKTCYVEALKELRINPLAHGQLTIRLLLDVSETCLRSQGFFDLWKQQKKYENESALSQFRSRLAEIDRIHDFRQRWIEICYGVLAGIEIDVIIKGSCLVLHTPKTIKFS
ncbi:Pantothenate kinase 4 [Eumeta japonica]|uniref:Pantothenate kinase 4 n=1 Tax=Eumeta variegata TaxID=151549 RepID=A0A4C1UXS8_EUMVA|nr:Pantothenate kinase 4 [Eumeta japonica]